MYRYLEPQIYFSFYLICIIYSMLKLIFNHLFGERKFKLKIQNHNEMFDKLSNFYLNYILYQKFNIIPYF